MNAAEITDKLGLHSLRQRAWVGLLVCPRNEIASCLTVVGSTFNLPAPRLATVSTKVSSGSATRSARLATSKGVHAPLGMWRPALRVELQIEPADKFNQRQTTACLGLKVFERSCGGLLLPLLPPRLGFW